MSEDTDEAKEARGKQEDPSKTLILPVGTQVVIRVQVQDAEGAQIKQAGAVGKIIKSAEENNKAYTVIFADGFQASLLRHELSIRKQLQSLHFDRAEQMKTEDWHPYIIYRCIVGSRAFGLDDESSDYDRRGIFLPPARLHWSIYGVPEQIENNETQECYFELQKFLLLALKANPNVLECFYTPLIEQASDLANELLAGRKEFLSRLVYQTYNGYVLSQFRKLEQDLRVSGKLKWKHVMHLIRLLLSGITILKEGYVPVKAETHRQDLLEIKAGQRSWESINHWRLALHKEFDSAHEQSNLPERPNYAFADEFLISARKSMVES